MKRILPVFLIIFCFVFCFLFLTKILLADVYYKKSRDDFLANRLENAFVFINYAIDCNPYEPLYYIDRSKLYISFSLRENEESREALKKLALLDLEKAKKLNPKNLRTLRNSFSLYYYLSILDLSKTASLDNIDPAMLGLAKNFYGQAKNDYPYDAGLITDIALYEKKLGLKSEFNESVLLIKSLRPDLLEWHQNFKD